jgi:Phasin protein
MLSADDDEPDGKVSRRKAKAGEKASEKTSAKAEPSKKAEPRKAEPGKKSEPRKRKEAKSPIPKPDQLLEALQRLGAQVEEPISEPILEPAGAPAISSESSVTEAPLPDIPEMSSTAMAEPAAMTPVSLQTIADAYGDFSKKSLEQTSTFVAKLATTRSFDKAFELQTAFAREAYETFVAESRRIRELHRELAKQRLRRLEGFVMGTSRSR